MNSKISTILQNLEKHIEASGNPEWNISRETGVFLNTIVRIMRPKRILEIGTSTGYSGMWLAEPLEAWNGKLVTVESHRERFQKASQHFSDAGFEQTITQVFGHAPEIIAHIEGMFDLMFFDATKLEHQSYFEACENKLSKNGLIITDNVISHKNELAAYISYVHGKQNFQTTIVPVGTGLMLSVRRS